MDKNNKSSICNSSLGEKEILYYLDKMGLSYIREFKITVDNQDMRRDFYLPEYNLMIEYNSQQHYQPVSVFGGEKAFEKQQERDLKLQNYCQKQKIKLLVISYFDYNNIKDRLEEALYAR